jgi:hypothetical protein
MAMEQTAPEHSPAVVAPPAQQPRAESGSKNKLRLFCSAPSYPALRLWVKTRCRADLMPARALGSCQHYITQL